MMLQGLMVLAYCAAMVAIGIYYRKSQSSAEAYYLANHGNGLVIITAGHVMGWIGAGDLIGVFGSAYARGLSVLLYTLGFALSCIFFSFCLSKRAYRIGNKWGCYTIANIMKRRFGDGTAVTFTVLTVMRNCNFVAGQAVAMAIMLEMFFGIPLSVGTALAIIVVLLYVLNGGLKATMMTTLCQMGFCFVGLFAVIFIGVNKVGGLTALFNAVPATFETNIFQGRSFLQITGLLLPTFFSAFTYNSMYMRTFSAKDESTAFKAGIWSSACVFLYMGLAIIGIFLCVVTLPGIENTDRAIYELLGTLPAFFAAFFSAAILAASMSTADECLIGPAAIFSKDIYKEVYRPNATDAEVLKVNKIFMIIYCICAWFLAGKAKNLLDLMVYAFAMLNSSFPVFAAMWFWPRANNQGAIAGLVGGGVASVAWMAFAPATTSILPTLWAGGAVSAVCLIVVTYMFPPPPKESAEFMAAGDVPYVRSEQPAA